MTSKACRYPEKLPDDFRGIMERGQMGFLISGQSVSNRLKYPS